jgi:hypothetical protein
MAGVIPPTITARLGITAGLGIPATLASAGAALGNRTDDLKRFELKVLSLAPQVEGHEMTQMLEGDVALELELERHRPAAIRPGLLPHFDDQISGFWTGVDQLTAHGDIVVALWQLIAGFTFSELITGFAVRKGAGLPDPNHLEVKPFLFFRSGINDPEMGLIQVEVAAHQGEQTPQNHSFNLTAIGSANQPTGELLGIRWHINPTHHANGPVLHRLGDR